MTEQQATSIDRQSAPEAAQASPDAAAALDGAISGVTKGLDDAAKSLDARGVPESRQALLADPDFWRTAAEVESVRQEAVSGVLGFIRGLEERIALGSDVDEGESGTVKLALGSDVDEGESGSFTPVRPT